MLHTTGLFPTEFDDTTNALFMTIEVAMGVPDEELIKDQQFLCDMLGLIGRSHPDADDDEMIHVMDMAYIGLIYHRHMPFIREETNEKVLLSERDPAGYTKTISMLSTALVQQQGVDPALILEAAGDAAQEGIRYLRRPETLDNEGLRLHTDFIAMCILGLLVHRLIPTTDVPPSPPQ